MRRIALALVVLASIGAGLRADEDGAKPEKPEVTSLPVLPDEIHDALQDRRFEEAVKQLDAELAKPKPVATDYLLYLKGRALTELSRFDEARETFTRLEQQHAGSRWVARARFGRAETFARQRDYRAAGDIYQAEARRLLSEGRRDELAAIYLEFADRYFEGVPAAGPSDEKKPDYEQALTYYQEALKVRPSLARRQEVEVRIARCLHELGRHAEAVAAWQEFLKQHAADDTRDERRAPPALEVEARFRLGHAQLAAGMPAEARRTWQDFLASSIAREHAGGKLAEAAYFIARTWGVPAPASTGDLELGVAALERFLKDYPDHELAAKAEFEIAQSYIQHGRHDQAIARLKGLIESEKHESSEYVAEARKLLGQSYLAQKKFTEAIVAWKEFLEEHPANESWSAVQQQVIDAEFLQAEEERQAERYDAARKLWSTFLNKYPLDPRAPLVLFRFGEMKFAEAVEKRGDADQANEGGAEAAAPRTLPDDVKSLFEEAIADWQRLVSKYPSANEASQAALMIGVTLEDQLGRLEDALEAYRKVQGALAGQAQQRIARLTSEQLEVITERKFRSNESPAIKLRTRNLEKLTIKVYRVDLADYFRKMHLATGVETLDIALIDPDKEWEYEVEDYEKYRSLTNQVAIPIEGAGVTAVTVSGDKLEATTMVVVSDIDVIVKSSRNELFAFAQNVRTGKPATGVSLLVSDGSEVFAEEVTGEDGVLQKSYERLKTVDDLRLFAVQEGHVASTVTSLQGLDFAVGLSPRGYLYTDRPAYRPGQLVNLKGIVRWVDQDRFTFKEGEKFKLDVYDPRGRVVHTGEVALGRFGTFSDRFTLPETVPQGDCRVHLHQPGGSQSYETTFTVHETQLEPVEIVVDLGDAIVYRGEKVEGTITLRYYYGTPLAGRTVQYQLADGPQQTATTDAEGKVKFEFETRRFSESQELALVVQYPERGLAVQETVFLATRGFDVAVSTLRNVYITGETFDVTAAVTDPAGEPVATDLKLEIYELLSGERSRRRKQAPAAGATAERLVDTHEIKSDKDGEASHTLRLEESGRYRIRVTGTDRFGNPVSGEHVVLISGDEDRIRLRILSEKHNYEVGDTAQVQVHWREKPTLALVTYEGARILGYRLIELQEGSNALEVPLESQLAPNFRLAVDVIEGSRFHQAASLFRVTRTLNVELKPAKTTLAPGDELQVDVIVKDPQGRPVSAELSLGLIQKNLLEVFPEGQTAIAEFFGEGERQPQIRSATSATFSYRPATRGISQFLLAEEDRRAILEAEVEALRELNQLRELGAEMSAGEWRSVNDAELAGVPFAGDAGADFNPPDTWSGLTVPQSGTELMLDGAASNGSLSFGVMPGGDVNGQVDPRFGYHFQLPGQMSGRRSGAGGGFGGGGFGGYGPGGPAEAKQAGVRQTVQDDYSKVQSGKDAITRLGRGWAKWSDGDSDKLSVLIDQRAALTPDGTRLLTDLSKAEATLWGVNGRGEVQVVNGLAPARLQELAKDGLQIVTGAAVSETGYWNPVIVTDESGQAGVSFRLPERSTAWMLRSKGVNAEALAGEAEVEIISKKDLFGELKTPLAFYVGDKARLIAEVHNSAVEKDGTIEVSLKTTIGDRSTELKKTLTVKGAGVEDVSFPVEITAGESAEFELTVSSGDRRDTAKASVPIRPFGLPVFATSSGTAAQNTIAFVSFDKQEAAEQPSLEIVIGPSINRTLLDAVLGGGLAACESGFALPASGLERSFSDLLGGVAVLESMRNARNGDSPEAEALAGRITSAISTLVSAQRDDGGWSWGGYGNVAQRRTDAEKPDPYLSSRALWALAAARRSGFAVPQETFDKAVAYVRSAFAGISLSDRETQTILLHALAEADAADFALANRLHRERNNLSPAGLVHLALALSRLDRDEMALELLKLLDQRPAAAVSKNLPWMAVETELDALHLLALEEVAPADPQTAKLAENVMAARRGSRWAPEKVNGPAIAALARWFGRAEHIDEKYELSVFVNDRLVETLKIDPAKDSSRRLAVPAELLVPEKQQRINFDITGRGRFSYSAVLSGFVPAEKLQSTTKDWRLVRSYEPAPRMLDGEPIPRGFHVLSGSYSSFRNPLTQLPLGERGEVTLSIGRYQTEGPLDYLIVTEPIPAGTTVLADSVQGPFERYEITPGAITFYIGDRPHIGDIRYTLVGYLPGEYRALPTVLRSFYAPDRIHVDQPLSLAVLDRGEISKDEYRLTPAELYEFGKRYVARRNWQAASEHLTPLFESWRLEDNIYQEVVRMLFQTSVELGSDDRMVQYFEIIKEKYPEVEIDFDDILRVAAAYRELGEYERSYLVFRATIEAAFEREGRIAGFLDGRGEFVRSVQVMERLLADYPAESYIAMATYALAGEVYGKAAAAAADEKLREAKITRVDLIAAAVRMLDHFLSAWPADPAADEAAFSLATALIDLEQYDRAIERSREFAERYADSPMLDSFWYVIGYSQFAQANHEAALEMCRKVADFTRKDPQTGVEQPAENKWQAIYIMGQVFHSLGQPADAIDEYEQVDERFPDAAQAIEYFTRKSISLPEVTTVKPGDAAEVPLSFRNVPSAEVKVYRIDLLKFGLMQRNLDRITAINLAGIRPYHELTADLGDGKDYRDRGQELKLPLKEEGAYLVVCRGGSLYASGLVLVSPLTLDVQEDATSGRVRVTVKNTVDERFAHDVHVKVTGSASGEFVSGETDLRGLFIADAIRGTSTVIARADDNRYAFHRGKTPLGEVAPAQAPAASEPAQADAPAAPEAGRGMLLDNVQRFNYGIIEQQQQHYRNLLENSTEGVKAKAAY